MKRFSYVLLFLLAFSFSKAQTSYSIVQEDGVVMSVKGSSTLHDWEAVASDISDYPMTIATDLSTAGGFENFGFKVAVESLDGGRGASMNKKIRKALLSTEHPNIKYTSKEVVVEPADDGSILKSKGIVVVAGIEKEIEVEATVSLVDDILVISGRKALKMGDFGIEPQSAMFGQIKTRDDITVHFKFSYQAL